MTRIPLTVPQAGSAVRPSWDDLPGHVRDTMRVKDDDWRLSFIMGNYVTLTNVSEAEFSRILRRRVLSLRAYDADGMMVWAEVAPGTETEQVLERLFAISRTSYVHIHYAQPGCYACRVDRA